MSLENQEPEIPPPSENSHGRWMFLRDVLIFEFKMFLDNLRDFLLMPASLIAAIIDIVFKGKQEGERFYKVLAWGRHSEEIIDVYGCIEHHPRVMAMPQDYTVDSLISRVEEAIVREYEKGGTAAGIKSAVDRVLDQIQGEARDKQDKIRETLSRAAEKMRGGPRNDGSA